MKCLFVKSELEDKVNSIDSLMNCEVICGKDSRGYIREQDSQTGGLDYAAQPRAERMGKLL